jgi:protein-tyrosine phosphatase
VLDLHCHILPGVDDGAIDLPDSLEMVRAAVEQGCRAVVATSHLGESLFDTSPELLQAEYARLVDAVASERIPLEIFPGAENFLGREDAVLFAERAVALGRAGRYVLFDFSMREHPPAIEAAIEALHARGRRAIIAHPERNLELMDDPAPITDWIARGALMQINAASLLGLLGRDAQEMAAYLLAGGACHVLASDAHDRSRRPFCLGDGRKAAAEFVGEAEAARLCEENPWKIIRGEDVTTAPPSLTSRSKGARLLRKLRNLGG